MDKIRVLNLKIAGRHGIYEFEKEKDYLFEIDLEVHKSLRQAGVTDKVKNTIDYNDLILFTILATLLYHPLKINKPYMKNIPFYSNMSVTGGLILLLLTHKLK